MPIRIRNVAFCILKVCESCKMHILLWEEILPKNRKYLKASVL